MNYLFYGTQKILIENSINKIISKEKIEEVIKYDANEVNINIILEDASYLNMFGCKKAIIINNISKLSLISDNEKELLEKYLKNPIETNYLFFIHEESKLDNKDSIIKLLSSLCIVEEYNELKNYELIKYIKDYLSKDNYQIQDLECKKIIYLLNNKLELFDLELDKFKIYKSPGNITMKDVENVISTAPRDDVFELVDAVVKNNKQKMFDLYQDLIKSGEEPIKIVVMLANQFRLFIQVKFFTEDGYKEEEIAKALKIHPYRVKLAIQEISNYKQSKLIEILKKLIRIDEKIKTENIRKDRILENFFLEI